MWQRKQTVFLVLALIALAASFYFPILGIEPKGMGHEMLIFNLKTIGGEASTWNWALFAFATLAFVCGLAAIFLYKKRRQQMQTIKWGVAWCLAWYVYLAFSVSFGSIASYHVHISLVLPLIAIILFVLAYKGVRHDDNLVRSADRIR